MNALRTMQGWTAVLCLAAAAAFAQNGRLADNTVIARVASEGITRQVLEAHLLGYFGKSALEHLVDRKVLDQEAARYQVSVSEADIKAREEEARKQFAADFEKALQVEGMSEEAWRERLRYTLLAEKVRDKKWPITNDDLVRLSLRYIRVKDRNSAREIIRSAKNASFDALVARSEDREFGGYVQPNPFFRVDRPNFFKLALESGIGPGQVSPQPLEAGGFWLVLRLEKRLGPETLKPREREEIVNRLKAVRMTALRDAARARYKIEYPVATAVLTSDPSLADDTVVAKIGTQDIKRKALNAYLLEYFGKMGLEQLVQRSVIRQEAARLRVAVSDTELADRVTEVRKTTGETAYKASLEREGISEDAWRERVRYAYLSEKILNARSPVKPSDLERLTVRYIRAASREDALTALQATQGGSAFDQALARYSLDKGGEGFIVPKIFLRVDRPEVFKAIADARLSPGQVLPQPLELAGSFAVLKLEARFGPETLSAKQREEAVRRINAGRLDGMLDTIRQAHKIEYTVPMKTLIADAKS
jgi:hypothetical protein